MADFLFTTPAVAEGPASWGDPLFVRVTLDRGITILNNGGVYTAVRFPTQGVGGEIDTADVVYMGGHEYVVSQATKDALVEADIGVTEANFEEIT
ncbi:hypothetical protein [Streptomyces halobius]|uniref:Uncharacterized protein n=1 Tax=Streptomyces halobius TaxID=2879846 RepID=A0ABY4M1M1_9ACTN|nr:hypothetical protein [Streptomyces halobius]UQA91632.1 hypothetical protein K9S39_06955 [Streptomyces halobius]